MKTYDELKVGDLIARGSSALHGSIIGTKGYMIVGVTKRFVTVKDEKGSPWEIDQTGYENNWYACEQSEDDKFKELLLND